MTLIDIYESIWNYVGWVSDDNDLARISAGDEKQLVMIDGKTVALPTRQHLRDADIDRKIIFHPLAEYTDRGESKVIAKLKRSINVMLNLRFGELAAQLLSIAADPAQQKRLTPEQMDIIAGIKDANKKSISDWDALARKLLVAPAEQRFISVHLRRGGEYMGQSYARVGLTVFPYYRELCKEKGDIKGIRKSDIEPFQQVHRAIFPEIDVEEAYNFGTSDQIAPFLQALLLTTMKLSKRMNEVVDIFGDKISTSDTIKACLKWRKPLQDHESLSSMIRQIPMQEGNDGVAVPLKQKDQAATNAAPAAYDGVTPAPAATQPPPQQSGYQYGYQAPAPAAPVAEDPYTSKGLSFKKLCQVSPAFAQGPNLLAGALAYQAAMEAAAYGHGQYYPQQQSYWAPPPQQQWGQQPPQGWGAPPPGYGPGPYWR